MPLMMLVMMSMIMIMMMIMITTDDDDDNDGDNDGDGDDDDDDNDDEDDDGDNNNDDDFDGGDDDDVDVVVVVDDDDDDKDGVEHVYWQALFGRNPSQELSGKYNWLQKKYLTSPWFPRHWCCSWGTYSMTICNEHVHETCILIMTCIWAMVKPGSFMFS